MARSPMMRELLLIGVAFLASCVLTFLVLRFAPTLGLMDVPNERSLHARVTPRGGGSAIVVVFLAATACLFAAFELGQAFTVTLLVGGFAVAANGLLDDRFRLPDLVRLPIWLAVAAFSVWSLGGLPELDAGAWVVQLGVLGGILAVIGVVWAINLYNFMDGIDGLAAVQAIVAGAAGGSMLWIAGERSLALAAFVLAAATAGFLVWNRPPARIFMGDVGSGFLGFCLAMLAIMSERSRAVPLLVWGLLLAPFLIDATFTVIRRVLRGEPFYKAHRSHAYQLLVQRGRSHRQVTLAYGGISLALVPIAYAAWLAPSFRVPIVAVVGLTLGLLWRRAIKE